MWQRPLTHASIAMMPCVTFRVTPSHRIALRSDENNVSGGIAKKNQEISSTLVMQMVAQPTLTFLCVTRCNMATQTTPYKLVQLQSLASDLLE